MLEESSIKHTIVSWDACYRNFFHLIDSFLEINYPREDFEIIYVEQRSKKVADGYNHAFDLKSLGDRFDEVKEKLNIKIVYLNDEIETPYNLGRSNNIALSLSEGEYVSIMDGDQLVPSDFLKQIDCSYKENGDSVLNALRKMCDYPVGVKSFKNWKQASINFSKCHRNSRDKFKKVPKQTPNKGPLISANRRLWKKIGGYDINYLWSTSISISGKDVDQRLGLASGKKSVCVPNTYTLHPWHPKGDGIFRRDDEITKLFGFQKMLIDWSVENHNADWVDRIQYASEVYEENKNEVDKVIKHLSENDVKQVLPEYSINKEKLNTIISQAKDIVRTYV